MAGIFVFTVTASEGVIKNEENLSLDITFSLMKYSLGKMTCGHLSLGFHVCKMTQVYFSALCCVKIMVNCSMLILCQLRVSHMRDQINCRKQDLVAEGLLKVFCVLTEPP